jgi:hypothetical protein
LFKAICTSGLYEKVQEIRCGVLGTNSEDDLSHPIFKDSKVKILYHSTNLQQYERPTLKELYQHSLDNNFLALYIHSKGVKWNGGNIYVNDWVNYLTYFNITKHKDCLIHLENNNVVGVNLQHNPCTHFSGNFWWSKSSFIKMLNPEINSSYCAPEFWITQNKHGIYYSLFNSPVDHYKDRYTPEKYTDN